MMRFATLVIVFLRVAFATPLEENSPTAVQASTLNRGLAADSGLHCSASACCPRSGFSCDACGNVCCVSHLVTLIQAVLIYKSRTVK